MRILFAGQAPISLTSNGVVVSMLTFARGLAAAGHEVVLATPAASQPEPELPTGVSSVRLKGFENPFAHDFPLVPANSWQPYHSLFQTIDLLHVHQPFSVVWSAIRLTRAAGKPVVGTYHTLYVEYAKHYVPVPILSNLGAYEELIRTRKYIKRLDEVIIPSVPMKRILEGYEVAKRPMTVIPTGVDLNRYNRTPKPELLKKYHLPTERPLILFVGRIAHEKNIRAFLAIASSLQTHAAKPYFVLVGDGAARQYYEAEAQKMHLANSVRFLGRVPKAETEQLFGQAAVFLFPSLTDTQGIVIVEAMAAGTPVVAANQLGPSAILTDNQTGFLLPPAPMQLVKKGVERVDELLSDPSLWRRLSRAGQKQAELYSVEATTKQLLTVYNRLVQDQPKSH